MKPSVYCFRILQISVVVLMLFTRANAAEPEEAYWMKDLDAPPMPVKRAAPTYPAGMKRAGINGQVTLEMVIDAKGDVIDAVVYKSNNPWFERPAITAVLQWKFKPGRKDGRPVRVRVMITLEFRISDGGDDLWQVSPGKNHKNLPLAIRWDKGPEPEGSTFPVYPAEALRAKTKGRAVVKFLVNPLGRIEAIELLEASAPEFGGAAVASVDVWRFKPATREGKPCSAVLQLEFDFAPRGDASVPVPAGMEHVIREPESRIYQPAQLDALPKPLSRRPPIFPTSLKKAGQPGEAVIEFFIDENGDAQLPRIVSATAPEFGYAAAQAVAAWRFEVPRKGGQPVIARVQVPLRFAAPIASAGPEQPTTPPLPSPSP